MRHELQIQPNRRIKNHPQPASFYLDLLDFRIKGLREVGLGRRFCDRKGIRGKTGLWRMAGLPNSITSGRAEGRRIALREEVGEQGG